MPPGGPGERQTTARLRADAAKSRPPAPAAAAAPVVRSRSDADRRLSAIRADIGADCSRCKLHTLGRKQVVFGVGNPDADLMFVGEAPGADEESRAFRSSAAPASC